MFVPKYQKKGTCGSLKKESGGIIRELGRQYGVELMEGYAMGDYIHLLLMILPKYSVAYTIGFLKGNQRYELSGTSNKLNGIYGAPFLGSRMLCEYSSFR